jgi:hypothetical protein
MFDTSSDSSVGDHSQIFLCESSSSDLDTTVHSKKSLKPANYPQNLTDSPSSSESFQKVRRAHPTTGCQQSYRGHSSDPVKDNLKVEVLDDSSESDPFRASYKSRKRARNYYRLCAEDDTSCQRS